MKIKQNLKLTIRDSFMIIINKIGTKWIVQPSFVMFLGYFLFMHFVLTEVVLSVIIFVCGHLDLLSACFLSIPNTGVFLLVVPVFSYSNADVQKISIIADNKGRSGIYR